MPRVGAHLRALMVRFGLTEQEFVTAFRYQSHPNAKIDQVERWLVDMRAANKQNIKRLTEFWRSRVPGMEASWWLDALDVFERKVDKGCALPRRLEIDVEEDLQRFDELELRSVSGLYRTYRFAFSNTGDVAVELLRVSGEAAQGYLDIETLGVSVHDASGVEHFRGKLWKLGFIYYGVLCFSDPSVPQSGRMRYVLFPVQSYSELVGERWASWLARRIGATSRWRRESMRRSSGRMMRLLRVE
jgi:hypothetical protein